MAGFPGAAARGAETAEAPSRSRRCRVSARFDHLRRERRHAVGVFIEAKRTADDDHDPRQRGLGDVGGRVELARAGGGGHRDTEVPPQSPAIEPEALQRLREHPVEQDDLTGGGHDGPAGPHGPVRESRGLVEGRQGRQYFQQVPERRVNARGHRLLGSVGDEAFEEIGQAVAGHELRHEGDRGRARIALDAAGVREALVLEARRNVHAVADCALEGGEFGAEVKPLEDATGLAVEQQRPAAEAILVPGRRQRRGQIDWWH